MYHADVERLEQVWLWRPCRPGAPPPDGSHSVEEGVRARLGRKEEPEEPLRAVRDHRAWAARTSLLTLFGAVVRKRVDGFRLSIHTARAVRYSDRKSSPPTSPAILADYSGSQPIFAHGGAQFCVRARFPTGPAARKGDCNRRIAAPPGSYGTRYYGRLSFWDALVVGVRVRNPFKA